MESLEKLDMDKISNRICYWLGKNHLSKMKFAREINVSRDVIIAYTNPEHPENSMQVETLIKMATYFHLDKYYFCNEYHKFLEETKNQKYLLRIRTSKRMTQRQFASSLNVSIERYKNYETERCKIPFDIWKRLVGKEPD